MFQEEEPNDDGVSPSPLCRGDQLFINNQAQVQVDALEDYGYDGFKISTFFGYSLAYLQAANRLVQTLNEHPSDILTLPIVFLYRHYVELTLKDLINTGNEKYGKPSTPYLEKIL